MKKSSHRAILVADLGFGDAGKGTVVDSLVRETSAHTVVRYNGGPQAAHNVIAPDGRHHTFSQFGAGTFVPGVMTALSRFMLVNPIGMIIEEEKLRKKNVVDAFARTFIDERCLIVTPFQVAANRIIEHIRGSRRNGSCGQGVGQTVADSLVEGGAFAIRAGDLRDLKCFEQKLREVQKLKIRQLSGLQLRMGDVEDIESEFHTLFGKKTVDEHMGWFERFADIANIVQPDKIRRISDSGTTIFEGAQGVLLDHRYGFFPHVTRSDTTFSNASELLSEHSFNGDVVRIGVARAYMTRHGAGPFLSEDPFLSRAIPDEHNLDHQWQQGFRVGWFDLVAMRYALKVLGHIDCLALTNMDRLAKVELPWRVCESYRVDSSEASNVSLYFEMQDAEPPFNRHQGRVTGIGMGEDDLSKLCERTDMFRHMKPEYASIESRDLDSYASMISRELLVPIGIVSTGPKADDKKYSDNFREILCGEVQQSVK